MHVVAHHRLGIDPDRKEVTQRKNASLDDGLAMRKIAPRQLVAPTQPSPPHTPRHAVILAGLKGPGALGLESCRESSPATWRAPVVMCRSDCRKSSIARWVPRTCPRVPTCRKILSAQTCRKCGCPYVSYQKPQRAESSRKIRGNQRFRATVSG